MKFSFLDFYKIGSIRKLRNDLNSCSYNYLVVRWFLDHGSLLNDDLKCFVNKNGLTDDSNKIIYRKRCNEVLERFAKEENFDDSEDLLNYSFNTCLLIFVSSALLFLLQLILIHFGVFDKYGMFCTLVFTAFPLGTFFIVRDFYPILSLFRISNSSSLKIKWAYFYSIHLNTLIFGLMLLFSFGSIL